MEDAKVKDQLEVCVSKLKHTLFVLLEKKEEGEGIGGGQDDNEEIVDEKQEFFIIIKRLLNLI